MALTIVYPPKDAMASPAIDIVAVHGLGGDAITTWTHPKSKAFWLKDFLPQQIPDARIMTFDYNAAAAFGQLTAGILNHAKILLSSLLDKREELEEIYRPIIFIAHSLGGIVVKQALLQAQLEPRYQPIRDATLGLIFLGTPHRGSDKATYGKVLADVAQFMIQRPSPRFLKALQTNSDVLLQSTTDLRLQLSDYKVYSFYEQRPMNGLSRPIVEKHSALIKVNHEEQIPVDADHRAMCKFETDSDDSFEKVHRRIQQMRRDTQLKKTAPASTNLWELELNERAERDRLNWKTSIIDLLKLLGLDSSLDGRVQLSQRLNVRIGVNGSAERNIALHTAIMRELAVNNGKITEKLLPQSDSSKLKNDCGVIRKTNSFAAQNNGANTVNEHFVVSGLLSPDFTGQENISRYLDSSFALAYQSRQPVQRRFVLFGVGGSGKTQICLKYAHAHRKRYWGIFWIDATTTDSIQRGLIQTATVLGVDPNIDSVKRVLANTSQSWLLVFDNADDPNLSLTPYFPASNRGDIIITSRVPEYCRYNTVGYTEIRHMSLEDSMTLLAKTAFGYASVDDKLKEMALPIVETLDCLALAIVQAGKYIRKTSCSLQDYLEIYERRKGEDDDELASVCSVDSLSSIATRSSTTLVGEVLAAANEFVSLLLEDQTLTPLLSTAFDRIKADRLERNIKRLLKVYAIDLRQEARDDIEKEAVRLILKHARYIAYRIRQRYDKSATDNAGWFERLIDQSSAKRALLEDYLRGRTGKSVETSQSEPYADDYNDGDTSDSSMSSEVEADQPELNDLDRAKVFMVESAAYHRFRQNLTDFVLPRREPEQQDSMNANLASLFSLDTWRRIRMKGVEAIHGLRMLSRPLVPPDHERINWICGCGDYRYADIREYSPNGASTLQAILRKSVVATNANSTSGAASTPPRPPTQNHLSGNSTAKVSFQNVPPSGDVYATGPVSSNIATGSSSAASPSAQSDHIFLLLCLTIGRASTLEQLSIRDLDNDQYLWQKIRERYHELRGRTLWHQKLSMTRWLSTISWLSWLVIAIDLTTANSIEFVRFQLVPIAMDIQPWNFHSPSFPPELEVRVKKTYHYDPCPANVDPRGLNGELLHCLWKPGPHLDRFWLNFFPKKLKETLQYVSSKPEVNTGWGIHVVEGVNWASVTYLGFILVSISAILGIVYSAITHDVGGGFGMAAFLGALPALGIALLQLRPVI